jgi:signal transduction histidine kinase
MSGASSVARKKRDRSARSPQPKNAPAARAPTQQLQRLAAAHEACKALLVGGPSPATFQALATALRQILEAEITVLRTDGTPMLETVSPRGADARDWAELVYASSVPTPLLRTTVVEPRDDRLTASGIERIVVVPIDPALTRGSLWLGYSKRAPFAAEELIMFDLLGDYMTHILGHPNAAAVESAPKTSQLEDLVSQAAHDLRTPLTPISMLLQTLERKAASGTVDLDSIGRARRQVQRLTDMVSDLVDLSRLQEGRLLLEPTVMDLREAFERGARAFRERERRRTLELDVGHEPLFIVADADRTVHAVASLLEHVARLAQGDAPLRASLERRNNHATLHIDSERPPSNSGLRLELGQTTTVPASRTTTLGLGVRLADALFERLGGTLQMSRARDGSTTIDGTLPLSPPPSGERERLAGNGAS